MAITTAMATSFKQELLEASHCFNATVNPTFTLTSGTNAVTTVSSMSGVAVGMAFTCATAGIPANTVVSLVTASNALTISNLATATITGGTATIAGDIFKVALIKGGMAGTYGAASTNYTNITGNADEVTGTGYTATGQALTNITAQSSGTTAFLQFSANPSWSGATFTAAGCMIYNTTGRLGAATTASMTGRAVSVHDFGGNQIVSSGTLTILQPTNDSSNALIRLQ